MTKAKKKETKQSQKLDASDIYKALRAQKTAPKMDQKSDDFLRLKVLVRVANLYSEKEFGDFMKTGDLPPVKLTKEEMKVLQGGSDDWVYDNIWPIIRPVVNWFKPNPPPQPIPLRDGTTCNPPFIQPENSFTLVGQGSNGSPCFVTPETRLPPEQGPIASFSSGWGNGGGNWWSA